MLSLHVYEQWAKKLEKLETLMNQYHEHNLSKIFFHRRRQAWIDHVHEVKDAQDCNHQKFKTMDK